MEESIEFNSNDYMNIEGSIDITEDRYPFMVNDILNYICEIKSNGEEIALIDIIMEYAFKNDINVEAVGDAISSDEYLKSFIEKDCELYRIIRTENQNEDW